MLKILTAALLLSTPLYAANAKTEYAKLEEKHKQERAVFQAKERQEKQRIREQAKALPESQRGEFLKEEMKKLEEAKNEFLRRQAKERQELFERYPELRAKNERAASKNTQRKAQQKKP